LKPSTTFLYPGIRKKFKAFLGRINFLRQFIPNYAKIVKGTTDMPKKRNEVKWSLAPHDSFSRIKESLDEAPILVSPNYLVPFYIFSFASPHTIAVVLLQKNKSGYE